MTERDYKLIAGVFKRNVEHPDNQSWEIQEALRGLIYNCAMHLEIENPRFDRSRFMKACGTEEL